MAIDDPFAEPEESERTVILPTPGGRRAPEAPASKTALAPAPEETRPKAPDADLPRRAARVFEKSADWQRNPLIAAALPLLDLAVQIRSRPTHFEVEELRERVAVEVKNFDRKVAGSGLSQRALRGARYALCATIDDVVLNTPQGGRSAWTQRGMVQTFHHEVVGGDRLWELLDQLKKEPANNLDLLELVYFCISLGFEGKYRVMPRGSSELADVRQDLFRLIRNNRGAVERGISPRWKPAAGPGRGLRDILPNWMVGLLGAAFLMLVYSVMSLMLGASSEKATAALNALHKGAAAEIERPEPVARLPEAPPSDLEEKVRVLLQKQIDEGSVTVDEKGGELLIRLNRDGMFRSGSAKLDPTLDDLIAQIGAELESEPGAIAVIGHTDNIRINTLAFPSNFQLSEARAEYVANLLKGSLSDAGRVSATGKGDQEPLPGADNATEEGRARNRRIEIILQTE